MVIGLNLCPFAKRVFDAELIRYVVTEARETGALRKVLNDELLALASSPIATVETTLLIHPYVLEDFYAFNDFLEIAEGQLLDLGLEGEIQLASFHPEYQFEGTTLDAVENYTNRSPYPILHLLREESVTKVAGDPDELLEIPRRNIALLKNLGLKKVVEMTEQNQKLK